MTSSTPDLAAEKFLSGYNCAQSVLHALADKVGFDKESALRIACGFGAGLGREQEVCGAVSGGLMAIGLKYGRGGAEEKSQTEECYRRTQVFLASFRQRHGSILCREIIPCTLKTPEGQQYFREHQLLKETCAHCVRTATELAEKA